MNCGDVMEWERCTKSAKLESGTPLWRLWNVLKRHILASLQDTLSVGGAPWDDTCISAVVEVGFEKVDQLSSRYRLVEPEVKELLAQRLPLRCKLTELIDDRNQMMGDDYVHYSRAIGLEQLLQRVRSAKHQRETESEVDPDAAMDSESDCVDSESECSDTSIHEYVGYGQDDYYDYDASWYTSDDDFIQRFGSVEDLKEAVRKFAEDQRVVGLLPLEDKANEQVYKEMLEESFQKKRRALTRHDKRYFTKRATNASQELDRRVQTISELSSLRARQRARRTLARSIARGLRSTEEQRYEHTRKELARMRKRAERTSKARATVHSKKAQNELASRPTAYDVVVLSR
jgi:hypothetical protein